MSVIKYKDPVTGEWVKTSSGGGGNADLNASEGEAGYVKNRTHWSEVVQGELLPETAFTPAYNSMLDCTTAIIPTFKLEVGKTYTVIFDGVEYTLTAFAGTVPFNFIAVGNTALAGGANTGEPFAIAYLTDMNESDALCMDTDEHTVQVIGDIAVHHQIPKQYLENAIPYYIEVSGSLQYNKTLVCYDTASNVRAAYDSGRQLIVKHTAVDLDNGIVFANYMPIVNAWIVQGKITFGFAARNAYMSDENNTMYLKVWVTEQDDGTLKVACTDGGM